ncbi:hypothetical protein A7A08_01824 [Methyloligella halotolerans]|uniref:DUF2849 domain-containing protein n=1 Tax=Methyloligella halotolerans TaxID=1177755 RepID=A0A1E2RY57_9HYPH|nr:DUF2849 domain-containing protein [Methyloligella halotolerans]ODA67080.1 hypothetical protein A7A08_01824 [Methyloligella halotolerans]
MAEPRSAKAGTVRAMTANRLRDGVVVYLATDGRWTEELEEARIAESDEEAKALEEQAKEAIEAREVVGAYTIAVEIEDGVPGAISVRERIRAAHRTTLTKDWYDVPL